MPSNINGSELINDPLDTIISPFTDILGGIFWLIPIGIIAVALFVKTRSVTVSSIWLMASTALIGTGVFVDYPEVGFIYYIFTVLGLVGAIVSIFFMKN